MREFWVDVAGVWLIWALILAGTYTMVRLAIRAETPPPEVTLPPIQARPVCDWSGPYPHLQGDLELWVVVCPPEGEQP